MRHAIIQAERASSTYEVPVGAIIVFKNKIIACGYNMTENRQSPLAHAEIMAIDMAANYLQSWRLLDCTMYVTLEPCAMCAGAIVNSRIERLVIGTKDKKRGCAGSVLNIVDHPKFNHRLELTFGVLERECSGLLKDFFKKLREDKKSLKTLEKHFIP